MVHRSRFYDFVNDIDNRHSVNFLETFPEMNKFYLECKQAKDAIVEVSTT
jgi:hypothetical protein